VPIGPTIDLRQGPPLLNDFLFGIILGDPRHWELQYLALIISLDNHCSCNDLVTNVSQLSSNCQTVV
jgi:hypothetical protein